MERPNLQEPQRYEITYRDGRRYVECPHCQQQVERTIVTHLKRTHPQIWKEYIKVFADFRRRGDNLKKIMWHFGRAFSWTVIERALAEAGVAAKPKGVRGLPLQPPEFVPENTTVWSFESRGKWGVHDSVYRGNWAPEIPRNLILRYSRNDDWILDPFVGGGTTAIECTLLNRNFIGFDINPAALILSRRKIQLLKAKIKRTASNGIPEVRLFKGDARDMTRVPSSSVDLVCAHPPYLDIVGYTRTNPADLSTITDPDRFIREMRKVSYEVYRTLKPGGRYCVLMGDVRRSGRLIPLGLKLLNSLLDMFDLEESIIKRQHQCSGSYFYKPENSFLRLEHEYLFVLRKPTEG